MQLSFGGSVEKDNITQKDKLKEIEKFFPAKGGKYFYY